MKRFINTIAIILTLMTPHETTSLWAQSTNAGAQSPPSGSTNSGTADRSNSGRTPSTSSQRPRFISGQVLTQNGQKIRDSVLVKLACGMRPMQAVRADLDGHFLFTFGLGTQGNMDFSAADSSPLSATSGVGLSPAAGAGRVLGNGGMDSSGLNLLGCDIQVSASGYEPVMRTITQIETIGTLEVGLFILRPIAADEAAGISVSSLMAPSGARREFEKAMKDVQQNHRDSAAQHLEKAVSLYDKFALAWYELGRIYAVNDSSKARRAFEKSIEADARFPDPCVSLAGLMLDAHDNAGAIQTAVHALEIQPRNGLAHFIQAAANFNLDRLEEAEKSARLAEESTHGDLPQLHALLASILLKKEDYRNAMLEMQAYLKEAPQGSLAPQMQRNLERLRSAGIGTESEPSPVPANR